MHSNETQQKKDVFYNFKYDCLYKVVNVDILFLPNVLFHKHQHSVSFVSFAAAYFY